MEDLVPAGATARTRTGCNLSLLWSAILQIQGGGLRPRLEGFLGGGVMLARHLPKPSAKRQHMWDIPLYRYCCIREAHCVLCTHCARGGTRPLWTPQPEVSAW